MFLLAAWFFLPGCALEEDDDTGDGVGCSPAECEPTGDPVPECSYDGCTEDDRNASCEGEFAYCFEGCVLWQTCPAPADAGTASDAGPDADVADAG